MDEDMLACSSSALHNQILQLLNTTLSVNSMMVLQAELRIMQRSSYYLEIHCDDLLLTAGQQQYSLRLSDSMLWRLIDQRRLQCAMTRANIHVKLHLLFLRVLYCEIIKGCQELEAFINTYDQGLVDGDMAASVQGKLRQTQQYINEFESRMTRNLGPLDLQNQLIPNFPIPQLSISVALRMPVIFERPKSCATSNTVHLFWEIVGQQSEEPNQQFDIHVKCLHPTIAEHGQLTKYACQSYNIQVDNLIPDRYYQFSVKRADAVNLVYGPWIDTIMLKTVGI